MIRRTTYTPATTNTFDNNLQDCLNHLNSFIGKTHVFGVVFFIDTLSLSDYTKKRDSIVRQLNDKKWLMPFNVLAQSAEAAVAIEIWLDDAKGVMEYLSFNETRYTRFTSYLGKSIWGIGITSNKTGCSLDEQLQFAFETMYELLKAEGLSLSDIIRQWNYVPEILTIQKENGKQLQHYQVFNDVRQNWYSKTLFMEGYPAATGIGVRTGHFAIDVVAIQSGSQVRKTGLSNPKQQNAYEYAQSHLIGDALSGIMKKAPLFERAKMIELRNNTLVIVSGTAAIIGQETVGIGDVRLQTDIAIKNMLELISKEVTRKDRSFQFNYLRVYIKDKNDIPIVREVCKFYFPDISTVYVQADVCRSELLMEIEGEAFI